MKPRPPLTTAQLAAKVGVSPARVRAIAAAQGIRPIVSTGRCHLWAPDAADKITRRPVGRPRVQ